MKSYNYPGWKRFIAIVMILLMIVPSSGVAALAEEPAGDEENTVQAELPTEEAPPHEHDYTIGGKAPTCTEEGYVTRSCACGDVVTDEVFEPLGHAWDEGSVLQEATTETEGLIQYACTRCGEERTESIPVLPAAETPTGPQQEQGEDNTEEVPEDTAIQEGKGPSSEGAELPGTPVTAGEEPNQAKGNEEKIQKVRVVFRAFATMEEPETEIETETDTNAEAETNTETEIPFRVSVYPPATEENPEPEAIPAEEDGSFLLLPGNYAYTAEAEGYAPIGETEFAVTLPEDGGAQTVELRFGTSKIMLFAAPALKATAPTAAPGKYRIIVQPKRTTQADYYSITITIEDADNNTLASQDLNYDPDDKWKETEAYFDLTASPAKITISSMYALAPNGGGGDYSTDPQAPHGGSYDYEQLSCTADFREGMDQRATAHSVKYPQDGEINFCDYSIQYLSEKGSLPYLDENGKTQYIEEGKWQRFIGAADQSGWYAVREDYESPGLLVSGICNLVLCEGVTMNISETGISIMNNAALRIWVQKAGSGTIIANGSKGSNVPSAGIEVQSEATLEISGGTVTATGSEGCAGIGGSYVSKDSGTIIINAGTVTATGGFNAAGIGGAAEGSQSGDLTINGGTINATGGLGGAGIGGGSSGNSGYIYITGGNITATTKSGGAGIGGGGGGSDHKTVADTIRIEGGTVNAEAFNAAGIGAGHRGELQGDIIIEGGTITAISHKKTEPNNNSTCSAGIGGSGNYSMGRIEISGGTVMGVSEDRGAGIGGGSGNNPGGPDGKGQSSGGIYISGADTDVMGISVLGAGIGSGGTFMGQGEKSGDWNGGEIIINDGFVYGRSYEAGAGIGGGNGGGAGQITINGGYVMGIGGEREYNWSKENNNKNDPFSGPGKHPINRWMDQDAFEMISNAVLTVAFSGTYAGAGVGGGHRGYAGGSNFIHINGGYVEAKAGLYDTMAIGSGYLAEQKGVNVTYYPGAFATGGDLNPNNPKELLLQNDGAVPVEEKININSCNFLLIEPGFNVSYNMLGHGTAPKSTKIAYGNELKEPEKPSEEGWTFLGWFLDEACTQKVIFPLAIGDTTTLYAGWKKNSTVEDERKVQLVWGEGESKPESVIVHLEQVLENGDWVNVSSITLNEGNRWAGSFKEVEAGVTYRIRETDGSGKEVLNGTEEKGASPFTLRNQAVFTVQESGKSREYQYDVKYETQEEGRLTTITHSRSGIIYTVKKDWKLNAGSYAWDTQIAGVSAVLQHLEPDGAGNRIWKTVDTLSLTEAGRWIGKFKAVPIESDENYRVREQVSNLKNSFKNGSGFVFEENDDTVRNEILYEPDDTESGGKLPILRYKWVVRHADGKTAEYYEERQGLFRAGCSRDESGAFVITNEELSAYPVWIFGTQITEQNREQYGFDPVTNTLILSGTPDGGNVQNLRGDAAVYAEGINLTIGGTAVIDGKGSASHGIRVKNGTLRIAADSELVFTGTACGIDAPKGLIIEKVKRLITEAANIGGVGIFCGDTRPTIDESLVIETPIGGKTGIGAIRNTDGSSAKRVVLGPGFTLSFSANGGKGSMQPMTGLVPGREYSMPACAYTYQDWEFTGWSVNGAVIEAGKPFSITEDTTATAQWTQHIHTYQLRDGAWEGVTRYIGNFTCTQCGDTLSHAAEYISDEVTGPATCTGTGIKTYTAHMRVSGEWYTVTKDQTIPALGHDWGEWTVTKEATETEEGIETRSCKHDPSHTETRPVPVKPHIHSLTKTDASAAACTSAGNIEYWTCSGCGKLFSDAAGTKEITREATVTEALGHSAGIWQVTGEQSATCTTAGYRSYELHCSRCRELLSSRGDSIPALGHDWGGWVITKEATETEEGAETRSCRRDPAHTESRTIPVKAHEHVLVKTDAVTATCTAAGNIEYWTCGGCGRLFSDAEGRNEIERDRTVIAPLGHMAESDWRVLETKDPTCTAMGYRSYELHCSRCGEFLSTRRETIPALGHAWGEWTVTKEATEGTEGTEIRTCARDSGHTESRTIPKKEHVHRLEHVLRVESTCTRTGNIECWKCIGCGKLFADAAGTAEISLEDTLIPAKGHSAEDSWTETAELAPSCEAEGIRRYELHCRNCGELLSTRRQSIPSLGHDWGNWVTTKEATETEEGSEIRICRRDSSHTEVRTVSPTAHQHTLNYVAAKAAACEDFGNEAYWMCTSCGRIFSDGNGITETNDEDVIIPPLGHTPGDWRVNGKNRAATCTEPGSTGYELPCARCGEIIAVRGEAIPALGHAWGAWSVTRAATEQEEGTETRTCLHDSTHTETRAIPRLVHVHVLERMARTEPACTTVGNIEYWRCSGCGKLFADAEGTAELEESDTVLPARGHRTGGEDSWTETAAKAATCTADGYRWAELRCLDCGEILSVRGQVLPATGHQWGEWFTEKDASETEEGLEKRICLHDNTHIETRRVPPTGHLHRLEFVAATAASCEDFGNRDYWMCTSCGRIFSDAEGTTETDDETVLIPPLGHSPGETWRPSGKRTDPTCTETGEEELIRRCTRCGEVVETRVNRVPALGHAWGDWTVIKEATEEEEGQEKRICAHDSSHTETRMLPRTPHEHKMTKTDAAAASCEEPGNTAYWTCSGCGKLFSDAEGTKEITQADTVLEPLGHASGEWKDAGTAKAASCTTTGIRRLELHCLRCDETLSTRDGVIPAIGHDWGEWVTTKEATEDETGEQTRTCAHDGGHTETRVIPRLEHRHNMTKTAAVEPECTKAGNINFWTCSGCGKIFADAAGTKEIQDSDVILPPTGHTAESYWNYAGTTREPTCTEPGYERLELHCRVCREVLSTRNEWIEPLGHDWGEWVMMKAASETEEGEQRRICRHDRKHVETRVVPMLEHTHTLVGTDAKAATCTEAGNTAYWTCSGCGLYFADAAGKRQVNLEDTVLRPLGHTAEETWEEGKIKTAATCTTPGTRELTLHCKVCDEVLSSRDGVIPASGHDWNEWTTTKTATESEEGEQTRTCRNDGSHVETRTIPKLEHSHNLTEVPARSAKCTEGGNIGCWICVDCGRLYSSAAATQELTWNDVVLPPEGHHAENYWIESGITTEPACTRPGYQLLELHCSRCNEVLSTRDGMIPAIGHAWGAWTVTSYPTETQEGLETRSCANDPTHVETRGIPTLNHEHTMTRVAARAAACTETGNIEYWVCSGCGLYFADAKGENLLDEEDTVTPVLGHIAGNWLETVVKEPTCTMQGSRSYELHCGRKGCNELLATRKEPIPALGHDWGEPEYLWSDDYSIVIAERTCSRNETHIEQELCDEIETYELSSAACEEGGQILYLAMFENEAFDDWELEETEPLGHDWGEWVTTREATEYREGLKQRSCRNDSSHVQTAAVPRVGHVHGLTKNDAVTPTCTEQGNIAYWICTEGGYPCGGIFTDPHGKSEVDPEDFDTLILPPLGHSWKTEPVVEWSEDNRSASFTFICERDESHTVTIRSEAQEELGTLPTTRRDGSIVCSATVSFEGEEYLATKEVPIRRPGYKYTEKTDVWIKSSGKTARFRVTRGDGSENPDNDALTFTLFNGIQVDNKSVAADQYTASEGSVILGLKPAFLETLSVGSHTLTANFRDGSVSTKFQVLPKDTTQKEDGTYVYTENGKTRTYSPKTGDESTVALWIAMAAVSGFGIAFCAPAVRKKRSRRKNT